MAGISGGATVGRGGGVTLIGRRFLGLTDGCLFTSVTGGMGTCGVTRPGRQIVDLNVNSMARPLYPTIVRTVRGTISRVTMRTSFQNCNPRQNCSFLHRTVVGGSFLPHNVRLSTGRIFMGSKTGDSAKGVRRVLE